MEHQEALSKVKSRIAASFSISICAKFLSRLQKPFDQISWFGDKEVFDIGNYTHEYLYIIIVPIEKIMKPMFLVQNWFNVKLICAQIKFDLNSEKFVCTNDFHIIMRLIKSEKIPLQDKDEPLLIKNIRWMNIISKLSTKCF